MSGLASVLLLAAKPTASTTATAANTCAASADAATSTDLSPCGKYSERVGVGLRFLGKKEMASARTLGLQSLQSSNAHTSTWVVSTHSSASAEYQEALKRT